MRSDAGMANRHEDVDLRFAQVSASSGTLAWLGLAWLGLAWLGLAWLGLAWLGLVHTQTVSRAGSRAGSSLYCYKM